MKVAFQVLKARPKKRPAQYVKPYKARSDIVVQELSDLDPKDIRARLLEWIRNELHKQQFREAVEVLGDLLRELKPPGKSHEDVSP